MINDDKVIFSVFDRLPRKLPMQKILKLYLCTQRWVDLSGMYSCVSMSFSTSVKFNKISFY